MLTINDLNGDYVTRDRLLFGEYSPNYYFGGIRKYRCSPGMIKKLLEMNFVNPKETQNESPSVEEFLDYLEDVPEVTFNGYVVSPERSDYRVSIEGFDVEIPDTEVDRMCELVKMFRDADEFNLIHDANTFFLHAWWD